MAMKKISEMQRILEKATGAVQSAFSEASSMSSDAQDDLPLAVDFDPSHHSSKPRTVPNMPLGLNGTPKS